MRRHLHPTAPALAAAISTLLLLAACGGDGAPRLQVERDTVGDTVIVRTMAGSAWEADAHLEPEMRIGAFEGDDEYILGNVTGLAVAPDGAVYIYDRQVPALRKYNADGEFVATLGREGGGPGEYQNADGGLAVLPDGRVLLRDPGNARITVYASGGEALDSWPLRGGFFTNRPLYVDTAGTIYTQIWGRDADGERYTALLPFDPDGTPGDSLPAPEWSFEPEAIEYSGERFHIRNSVPFTPQVHWTFSPMGHYVGGLSTEYAIDVFRPDGRVVRIQRVTEPVPVESAEQQAARQQAARGIRRMAPDWQWNGPPIPDTKPPFQDIAVGRDGRIWVRLHQPGYLAERADPGDPEDADRWEEPVVWDVFEPDGTYLGQVRAPDGFRPNPEPVFGADHVWAITTDELDVQYLTRFRIVHGAGNGGAETE